MVPDARLSELNATTVLGFGFKVRGLHFQNGVSACELDRKGGLSQPQSGRCDLVLRHR